MFQRWITLLGLIAFKGAGIFIVILGGIILVKIPSAYKSEVDFQAKAISTTGRIIETRSEKADRTYYSGGIPLSISENQLVSKIQFQTNEGELIEFTTGEACPGQPDCKSQTVPVLYDPVSPLNAKVDAGLMPRDIITSSLIGSIVMLLSGIAMILIPLK